jgi:hypothetical protein
MRSSTSRCSSETTNAGAASTDTMLTFYQRQLYQRRTTSAPNTGDSRGAERLESAPIVAVPLDLLCHRGSPAARLGCVELLRDQRTGRESWARQEWKDVFDVEPG